MARTIALDPVFDLALWLCALDETPPPGELAWLDDDESLRAQRFVHEVHRRRYLAAHVALRDRLAASLNLMPRALRLAADANGKPCLQGVRGVEFNLSHSGEWALLAIGRGPPLGVDIEVLRPLEDAVALARRHYSPREQQDVLAAREGTARDIAFLRVWTRKEACLKAVGLGLRIAPSSFEAGAEEGPTMATLKTPQGAVRVEVQSLATGVDAVAAVARVRP